MKRVVIIAAAFLMILSLAACQEREVTGSYGTNVATGRVITTGDLEGSSPAGIDVRVVGTGMVTTLDASGRFSFVGVPENVTFHFTRNDGVDATYEMGAVERNAEITLSKRQASKSRRRGVGHPGVEIEGLIQAAATETLLTVMTGNGTVYDIALTPDTIIRKGNQTLTWEDLVENARVHVKAIRGEDDALTAVEVKLQNGDGNGNGVGHPGVEIEGLIQTAATETLLTVMSGNGTVYDIALTPDTIIRKGNVTLTWEALVEGARVHVKATVGEDESLTAVEVKLQKN